MKTVIVFKSEHHKNTYKLVKAIADKYSVDLIDVADVDLNSVDLNKYDKIGFAAGIAFGKFYKEIEKLASEKLPKGKDVFLIYTCGSDNGKYTKSMKEIIGSRDCNFVGSYGCPGCDTYGPFKLIGGLNKNRPNEQDVLGAVEFFGKL